MTTGTLCVNEYFIMYYLQATAAAHWVDPGYSNGGGGVGGGGKRLCHERGVPCGRNRTMEALV